MGNERRSGTQRQEGSNNAGWSRSNPGASGQFERFLEGGKATRFKQKYPAPSAGDRFGEFTVVRYELRGKRRGAVCTCSCGAERFVDLSNLYSGKSTRCGACGRKKSRDTNVKRYFKYAEVMPDAEHRRRLCNRLSAAIGRCHNPKSRGYSNYGGRGIEVCEEWRESKRPFLIYVQALAGWDDPTLEMDRVNTDGNYEPGNIRFVTKAENGRNKRSIVTLQKRVDELERRLRHCKCGAASSLHD